MKDVPFWLRSRVHSLAVFWTIQGLVMYALVGPATWLIAEKDNPSILRAVTPLGVVVLITALQAVFFWPIRRPGVARRGRSLYLSMAVGGLLIGTLVFGACMAISQLLSQDIFVNEPPFLLIGLGAMLGAWLLATPLLIAFARCRPRGRFIRRLSSRLFLGTVVEAAAIIPLDVFVRRRDDCICATGTYIGLTLCGVVGLFVMGPAVFLPLLARRRKRWFAGRCDVCGYDMGACMDAPRCPECGAGWRARLPGAKA